MNSNRFNVRPLFLQVRDVLAQRISLGVWKANAVLPNELMLAQEFGVSQGTVRKALDTLEAEKIVWRKQGQGTFVVDHGTAEMAIRFSNFYNQDGVRIGGTVVWHEGAVGTADAWEVKRLDVNPGDSIVRCKRLRAYQDQPFLFEELSIAQRRFPKLEVGELTEFRITALAQQHGVQLKRADERVQPALPGGEIAARLKIEETVPVLKLDRIVYSIDDEPVEWRRAWYHQRGTCYIAKTH